uniref:Putative bpti/kunitz family of serine protease inhibitor n=1 Tax=Amblyomma americanum TaxID=6943 RepID=A0A0C9SD14_AMBAM
MNACILVFLASVTLFHSTAATVGAYNPELDMCREPPPMENSCGQETNVERWYFNATQETCLSFKYFGCGESINNFPEKDICQQACQAVSRSLRTEPLWFYNTTEKTD